MPALATIVQIILLILGAAVPTAVFFRILRADDSWSLANIFAAPDYNAWPRGVQEEEPFRWGMGQNVPNNAGADEQAEPATIRTAPRQLRPAASALSDDPIAEVA